MPKKRVLIVDDEEDLTWTLVKKLSKDSDKFELICVNSGKEALDVLSQVPVDLVITDVRMPEVSGLDLLVTIKENYPVTKVVIMTAYGSSDVQKEATERGCLHYIEKPFEINDLRQLILDALTEKRGFKGSVSDFQLSDIIQLNCLGRLTSALQIRNEGEEGIIYFQEGNIVHAEMGTLEGEAAFFHIMSWPTGEFSVARNRTAPKETIRQGWQSLLLESLRRVDEHSQLYQDERELEKQHRMLRLRQLLEKLYKKEGVEHILVLTRAGFPIAYLGGFQKKPEHITELGNRISSLLENTIKHSKFLNSGLFKFQEIRMEGRSLILQSLPTNDAWITVIGNKRLNTGYLRMELRKLVPALKEFI